ncbi:MAG TPA: amphi-Trp domain-containing protein [Herpetosiphonaceae bacterium]|nr:amphi-Trp domain-containing protein [Herpetosiphonaceae bacterium]
MSEKPERDVEKVYAVKDFVAKLRRLADALEQGQAFKIQVAGERFTVPADAQMSVEHERSDDGEELEFQLTWNRAPEGEESEDEESEEEDEAGEEEESEDKEETTEAPAGESAEKPADD